MGTNREPIIGIDLGTTNSCVAVVENGVPVVIPNRAGYRTTPSVVAAVQGGRHLIGQIAKRQAIVNPENTVYGVKRLIGRRWSSTAVASGLETYPYRLVEGPNHDVRIVMQDNVYSLPEISGMILDELKMVAQEHVGREVSKCVITVPAYFDDGQRQATQEAGRIAGLDVIRIINEPTAAALAYGYGKGNQRRKLAVFDLGGGTFDISILEIGNGVFEVISTAGDTYLGGDDFDTRIIEWLVFGFLDAHQIDLRRDKVALQRVRDAAESAKCQISTTSTAEINLPFIFASEANEPLHLRQELSRVRFEEAVGDLIDRCMVICERALADAGLRPGQLDDVVMIGGQSRAPCLQRAVRGFFGVQPTKALTADEVVSQGAAIQGAALFDEKSSILLLDVTPHDLGIMIMGGYFQKIIEKNTTIPTSASRVFTTVRDNQTSVRIVAFQGNGRRAEDNDLLGEFVLDGLREAPAGVVEVEVSFMISSDGIFSIQATDLESGRQHGMTLAANSAEEEEETVPPQVFDPMMSSPVAVSAHG